MAELPEALAPAPQRRRHDRLDDDADRAQREFRRRRISQSQDEGQERAPIPARGPPTWLTWPPPGIAGATFSWLYMPLIMQAAGLDWPASWTFDRIALPLRWDYWVSELRAKFQTALLGADWFQRQMTDGWHLPADVQENLIDNAASISHEVDRYGYLQEQAASLQIRRRDRPPPPPPRRAERPAQQVFRAYRVGQLIDVQDGSSVFQAVVRDVGDSGGLVFQPLAGEDPALLEDDPDSYVAIDELQVRLRTRAVALPPPPPARPEQPRIAFDPAAVGAGGCGDYPPETQAAVDSFFMELRVGSNDYKVVYQLDDLE